MRKSGSAGGRGAQVDSVGPLDGFDLDGKRIWIDGRPMRFEWHVIRYQKSTTAVDPQKFWCVCRCGYKSSWRPLLAQCEEAAVIHLIKVARAWK